MRGFRAIILVLAFFALPFCIKAQPKDEALTHSRAGFALEQQGKFAEALYEYNAAIAADSRYPYPVERIAAMYQTLRNYKKAIEFYHRAIGLDSSFDVYNFYNLGLSYRLTDKFDSAVMSFKEFIRRTEPVNAADSTALRDADFWVKFNLGSIAERAKPKMGPEPISLKELNSPYPDFGPTITADGQTLYFTSGRPATNTSLIMEDNDYGEDLFVAKKDTGDHWKAPQPLPPPINSTDKEGTASISADGQTVYYSLCRRSDGMGDCDLYISELNGDQWTPQQNLGSVLNSSAWDAEPSISADGSTLYFSSRRPGSIDGSEDIWVAYRDTKGNWTVPTNLGDVVNTRFNERSPFIAADGKTLYFSSNGHPGFGNQDLFMTKKLSDGTWSVPINLGSPINSKGDDEFLTIPASGRSIIYSSQRDNPKDNNIDLYYSPLPEKFVPGPVTVVAGRVYDKVTGKSLAAKIVVSDIEKDEIVAVYRSNKVTGKFFITLGTGKQYLVTAEAPNYTFHSENYTVPDTLSFKELTHDLPLVPLTIASNDIKDTGKKDNGGKDTGTKNPPTKPDTGKKNTPPEKPTKDTTTLPPITLKVFFDFNKATLRKESVTELNNLVRLMKENPTIRVEVSGHTDSIGSAEVNKKLSQDRAEAVRTYVVEHGITPKRIVAVGYGSTRPVDTNATDEGRQNNRRTEFRIIK